MKTIRRARGALSIVLATAAVLVVAQGTHRNEPIQPLPDQATDVDAAKVKLGARLFADKRFSADNTVSCQSCHLPEHGGADPRRHSVSAFGKVRELNSPTILNVRYNTSGLNWTGRTRDLDAQIAGSIGNADTMAHDWGKVMQILAADPQVVAEFKAAYGGDDAVSQKNAMHAIVSFEKSLVTPSRFDDWLKGDDRALTAQEQRGYDRFKAYGCVGCHNGINVGGNGFMKLGIAGDYFAEREKMGRGAAVELDKGRLLVTKKPEDLHVFRVPSLRNVALTAPYFHDGAVPTLDEAIQLMGRFQLGREIPAGDRQDIAAFLQSLTGKQYEQWAASPASARALGGFGLPPAGGR
ncbi:c-type cytochrome [Ramlibacter sp. USB13]|uniref:C-type cytochrome n=1 Tax=Ramlibacter cellulosilyticus TaxID=2764187 RepID=A0A923MTZ2_9BURK|nr:cytochrome c peroxidase [Ramlibacter cellulosilyticus]MBC5783727.1 c-type cytochrome [Ramlibacter cellulosilyticus]